MLNVIQSLYKSPKFRAKFNEETSEVKTQDSGIRQGCPLSPYLFILLMTVMFHDVYHEVGYQILGCNVDLTPIFEILYADDTLLIPPSMLVAAPCSTDSAALKMASLHQSMIRLRRVSTSF